MSSKNTKMLMSNTIGSKNIFLYTRLLFRPIWIFTSGLFSTVVNALKRGFNVDKNTKMLMSNAIGAMIWDL
jgi:uncharacterized membrane protein YvlD (DUF360 family)